MGFLAPIPFPLGISHRSSEVGTAYTPTTGATQYSAWLLTPTGTRIALIERYIRLQYTLTANQVGVLKADLLSSFPLSYVQEDSRLEVWRQVPGGKKYLDGDAIWLVRDWDHTLSQFGQETISLLAFSGNEIMDRPIVDYNAGTAYALKTDVIDDMMKAIVRENRGSLASADRDISDWLAVEADFGDGPSTTKSFAWRNVLTVLRELAQEADNAGTPVFFDVVYDPGGGGLTFRTFTGQRGVDQGSTSESPIVLSPRNGTLAEVQRSYASSGERNAITVGGRQQGAGRMVERDTDDDRIALSPFNRSELFVDARNMETTAELQAEAAAALKANRPRESFTAKIRDTNAIRYGREYNFGDRVSMEFRGRMVDCRLDSVTISVEQGRENIRAELRADG